ncbi:MAG: HD domain-containing protein [Methylotenera sp.]|nr:HD domain-containing protein [Methylotenera sp.]MDO9232680.1 HD domain-containing protein [Methylotenera sp.]MDO9388628.1 HD domain-containing protein [Methylotenera sp.]MDP1596093.1 HD domain-containing protein [Methylotenera sp.]MDP1958247.1 HD domain-containing protein [Methylotenera sp.]
MNSVINHQYFVPNDVERDNTLTDRIHHLHERIITAIPDIDRIACATYDAKEDQLRTFINSTLNGKILSDYSFKLSDSQSLSRIAETGESRVIDDIQNSIQPISLHSSWLLSEGYHSSFTIPMYDNDNFIGLIFFDSYQSNTFTTKVQRDIRLYANLITMSISSELSALRNINASVRVARQFTQLRDFETGEHLERMARYARIIAKGLAPHYNLSDEFIEHVFLFAPLHDIGKIGIPDSLLLKPGKFTAEERQIMESHVLKGVELIQKILGEYSLEHLPDSTVLMNIVSCHHEFLDGSGYPKALKATDIAIEARIITAADIFDALTSHRPYKTEWSVEDACIELQRMVEMGKVDADCVNAIISSIDEIKKIHNHFKDVDD